MFRKRSYEHAILLAWVLIKLLISFDRIVRQQFVPHKLESSIESFHLSLFIFHYLSIFIFHSLTLSAVSPLPSVLLCVQCSVIRVFIVVCQIICVNLIMWFSDYLFEEYLGLKKYIYLFVRIRSSHYGCFYHNVNFLLWLNLICVHMILDIRQWMKNTKWTKSMRVMMLPTKFLAW